MHERFKALLAALEEARRLQDQPVEMRHIRFIRADGSEIEATVAKGPRGFICRRAVGEELDAFYLRADAECRAANPRGWPF
jgi:hypothetical protein